MNSKLFISFLFFFNIHSHFCQNNFYSIDTVREIKFYFDQPNWKNILDSLYIDGQEERILASIVIDGLQYDSVGIRYKGYSSVNITQTKNPFNIKLDYVIEDQEHFGINKIKLSNVIHDPSFLREALSYQIARKYMPAPEANFANLYINDTLWGLYSNVESINKDFLSKHYKSRDNVFFKCNPKNLDLFGENSNLSLSPGSDTLNYEDFYTLKSDYGFERLHELIDTLNNYSSLINNLLNVDRTLWMHAFNYNVLNLDSYIGYSQNYYMYEDNSNRFNPILWDLNMSFASFRLTDASSYFSGFNISQAKNLDPLTHFNDISVFPRPLMRQLFMNDRNRKMYIAHLKTIMEENFSNLSYMDSANKIHSTIDQSVLLDTNKFYSYADFQNNINSTVNVVIDYPGINDLMNGRLNYLSNYPGINHNIIIDSINELSSSLTIGDDLWVTANVIDANEVLLFYRSAQTGIFQEILMNDDGNSNDGIIGDNKYGGKIPNIGNITQYYIYAENDSSGQFSPERAQYEFYEVNVPIMPGQLVINELLAINNDIVQNEFGEYADWIELYNASSSTITCNNLYISDDLSNIYKWRLNNITIPSNNYLIIWADENTGLTHTNFNLSSNGESLLLCNELGSIIDSVTFPDQSTNVAYARMPNGSGPFIYKIPSFNYNNNFASLKDNGEFNFSCYPNPVENELTIYIKNSFDLKINIFDIQGKKINCNVTDQKSHEIRMNTSILKPGMYFVQMSNNETSIIKKIIK